ncbi:MAG: MFS transporter [Firmicutes bacterium]|nr:MFS transporter [Bacillota bacterium]
MTVTMQEKSLFKNFNFMLLWAGQSVSQLGTALYNLAIMWYILEKTGSTLAMGISVVCFTLPTTIIGPIAGVFADKHDKKKIIVITDCINGLLMLALSYFIAVDNISIGALYVVMALGASVSAVFTPAITSSMPMIVDSQQLTKANSLSQFTSRIVSILGPALAGILIAILDMWILFFINGISYLISAISESFITIPKVDVKDTSQKFVEQFKEGLSNVWNNKLVLYLVISGGIIINFFLAPLSIYSAVISANLDKGATGLGIMQASVSIGALLGSVMILLGFIKNKYKMAIAGLTLEGLALIALGLFIQNYYLILFFMGMLGLGVAMASVGISTLYQILIPKEKMGRVMSIVTTLCSVTIPLGTLFGSVIINYHTMENVLIFFGVIVSISGLSLVGVVRESNERKEEVFTVD